MVGESHRLSTGVRSAGVAAITSHNSLYCPPPIGVLLNLKYMQLFPPSRASVSLNPDKESAEQEQQGTSGTIKRQFERLPDCLMWSFKKKEKKISNTRTHLKVIETISVIQEQKKFGILLSKHWNYTINLFLIVNMELRSNQMLDFCKYENKKEKDFCNKRTVQQGHGPAL